MSLKVVPHTGTNPSCLGCCVTAAIRGWVERCGERTAEGEAIIDVQAVITVLASEIGELIVAGGRDRPSRRRIRAFAHDAVDGAVAAALTGQLQPVAVPPLETEH